jgi:anti-sigma factor RsiW
VNDLALTEHVDEVDLVRHLDGALDAGAAAAVAAHLASCERCAERLRLFGDWSRGFSQALQATDAAVQLPDEFEVRGRGGRAWQIAASIALLVAFSAAVSPVRAWFLQAGRSAWVALMRPASGPTSDLRSSSTVTSRPNGRSFSITVPGAGQESHLTIEVVAGDNVSATAVDASGTARMFVLPDGLRLGTGGEYLVRVPARLERVMILRDSQTVRSFRPSHPGERWDSTFQRDTGR